MDATQFAYWMQGFVEMTNADSITPEQWKMIKDHLALTMTKVTPAVHKEPQYCRRIPSTGPTPYLPFQQPTTPQFLPHNPLKLEIIC